MKIEVSNRPDTTLTEFLSKQLVAFNKENWDVSERHPISAQVLSPLDLTNSKSTQSILAGASGTTFGNWLHIERLWVSEELRGNKVGSKILLAIENAAKEKGCTHSMLDTLEFQAKPFYERHGYQVQWTQENYPKTGSKFFMTKAL